MADFATESEVRTFVLNEELWYCGSMDISQIDEETIADLLETYGYDEDNPLAPEGRNQIIIECYFETYSTDFRNDI